MYGRVCIVLSIGLLLVFALTSCEVAPAGYWTVEQAFNEGLLEDVEQHVSQDFVLHTPDIFDGLSGVDGYVAWVNAWRAMLPDLHIVLLNAGGEEPDWVGQSDSFSWDDAKISEEKDVLDGYNWRLAGTHTGSYKDIQPTGHEIAVEGHVVAHYEDDLLSELWLVYDSAHLSTALGVPATEFVQEKPVIDLSRVDLSGERLVNANLRGVLLVGANLQEANLGGTNLQGADLHGADLRNADLLESILNGANLSGADLRDADLTGVQLREADFTDAVFDEDTVLPEGSMGSNGCLRGCWSTETDLSRYTDPAHPDFVDMCSSYDGLDSYPAWHWICEDEGRPGNTE